MSEFPDDADGDALRELAGRADITKPMIIEFTIAVPDESSGREVQSAVGERGYEVSAEFDKESGTWTCYCKKSMVPSYDAVVAAQGELNDVSAPFGGACDGWGTFGQ